MQIPSSSAGVVKAIAVKLGEKVKQESGILGLESVDSGSISVLKTPLAQQIRAQAAPENIASSPSGLPPSSLPDSSPLPPFGRFVFDAVRQHLRHASGNEAASGISMLSHLAKTVSPSDPAKAKRRYPHQRGMSSPLWIKSLQTKQLS